MLPRGRGGGVPSRGPSGTRLRTRVWGGGDRIRIRIRIHAFTVNRVAKYMRNGATPEKPMVSGDALRVSSLVPCRAQRVVRDAGWEQACVRSFARVFCVSQERWVVDGADRQQVRNTLNVHDSAACGK